MKQYVGERTSEGVTVRVIDPGHPAGGYPLDPRFDLRRHADSLNWGYAGSGPAQLALALLADALGDSDRARDAYQSFKRHAVARWDGDQFRISEDEIRQIVAGLERARGRGRA